MVLGRNSYFKRGLTPGKSQVGILSDQIFDPPKKLKRVNGLGEERKVMALLPGSPKQIQRLSLP